LPPKGAKKKPKNRKTTEGGRKNKIGNQQKKEHSERRSTRGQTNTNSFGSLKKSIHGGTGSPGTKSKQAKNSGTSNRTGASTVQKKGKRGNKKK